MSGTESLWVPAVIKGGASLIGALASPQGENVVGFPASQVQGAFNLARQNILQELNASRAARAAPITIPAAPGFEGLGGDMKVAGLPTGTVGLTRNVQQAATAPLSFASPYASAQSFGTGSNSSDEPNQPGEGPGSGEHPSADEPGDPALPGSGDPSGPGENPFVDVPDPNLPEPPGGNTDPYNPPNQNQPLVFATKQDRDQALNDIALTLQKLMSFKSRLSNPIKPGSMA